MEGLASTVLVHVIHFLYSELAASYWDRGEKVVAICCSNKLGLERWPWKTRKIDSGNKIWGVL